MTRKKKAFLLTLAFILAGTYLFAEAPLYDREISFPREIFNFHLVAPGIMRGSQPSEKALCLLREYFLAKTILSFRAEKEHNQWEKEIVEKLGMNFINIPMDGRREQGIEKIEQCLAVISNKANQPIFVHCQAGKDRTGMVFAAYRIKYNHWDFKDALQEMLAYGYDRSCCSALERSLIEWNKWREKVNQESVFVTQ